MINEDNKEYCLKKEKKFILCEKFAFRWFYAPNNKIQTHTFIQRVYCNVNRISRGLSK